MSPSQPRMTPTRIAAALATFLFTVALTGCIPDGTDSPTVSPSPSPTPSASASPDPEPSPEPEPGETATPVDLTCAELVSPEAMYEFNPNFVLLADWVAPPGSAAADAVAAEGIACRWQNQTSSDTIDVSVAMPGDAMLADLSSGLEGEQVSTFGEGGFFTVDARAGTATVITRGYWLVATSAYFSEPGDAADLVNAALAALP